MAEDCIFCRILSGEIPATVVLDNDQVLAFRDVTPRAPTHVLVVPRRHIRDIAAIEPSDGPLLAALFGAANAVADGDGIVESGYRLVLNVGPDAGQTVFHLHLHVLGGRVMSWPPG
jgi:histidine triad (HIT) family protein